MRRKSVEKPTLSNTNWQYDCQYDYDNNTENCQCDGYCRCGVIDNARVTEPVSTLRIIEKLYDCSNIEKYCIDRILTHFKIYQPYSWCVRATGGYYGEEVEGVYLENAKIIEDKIQEMLNLKNNTEKIESVLMLEYGFLLESVKNLKWSIKTINKNDIFFPQDHYVKKVELVKDYEEYTFPLAVVLSDENKFRVVDGYHRLSANKHDKIKVVVGS